MPTPDEFRIAFFGDVIGKPGRRALAKVLTDFKKDAKINLVVVNAENAAGGFGLTPPVACELFEVGVDILTSGNHIWRYKEVIPFMESERRLIRPANYPARAPGRGWVVIEKEGVKVGVLNLQGRVFMDPIDCPFQVALRELEKIEADIIIVDFHAEATSEKKAMGYFLDGKVGAVIGTHTHVQTADAQILPGGTAYITDAGMVGPEDSVIGMEKEKIIQRFLTGLPQKMEVASGKCVVEGVVITFDREGRASQISAFRRKEVMKWMN